MTTNFDFGPNFKIPSREDNQSDDWYLEQINSHRKDSNVSFDEIPHKYYFDNCEMRMSVTQMVEKFFEKFDSVRIATKMINGRFWPREKYTHDNGVPFSLDEIVANWEQIGLDARNRGYS
jgi:hypothetical protein